MTLGDAFPSILAAAKAGEDWAWAAIYRDLAGPVTRYLARRGAWDADDVTSETFLKVAGGIHGFEGEEHAFRAWVFVIAHRRLIDERRKATRRGFIEWPDDGEALARMPGGDVENEAMAALEPDATAVLLSALTNDQRDVLMLRVVAGLNVNDTAAALGKSAGSVKVIQHRALAALRKAVGSVTPGPSETIQEVT